MNLVFHDRRTQTPLYSAEVPEGFCAEASFTPMRFQLAEGCIVRGTAAGADNLYRLYFRSGATYSYSSFGSGVPEGERNEDGTIIHVPCDASLQFDEFAAEFAGAPIQALSYANLTQRKCQLLQPEQERELQKQYQLSLQAASISAMPMNMQLQGTVNDGGTGLYAVDSPKGRKYLLVTLWRRGLQFLVMPQGLNLSGYYAQMAQPVTMISWQIPLIVYMLSEREPDAELTACYNRFYETLQMRPELRRHLDQMEQENLQRSFSAAEMQRQRTQAEIRYAFQKQQEGWARSDALRQSLSADLDSFRAGLNQRMADYDRMHAPGGALYSSGAPSMEPGTAGESTDDRIQRLRHESMMGVNTYTDDEGRDAEFSTQADRVFQNNLDSTARFGKEHYYDDYVPEGWSELFRKQ